MGKKIRVGVIGANGKMGSSVVAAIQTDAQCELVAAVDIDDSLEELLKARCEVVVDFTNPAVVMENLAFCIKNGIHAVVGTSGLSPERVEIIQFR